VEINGNLTAGKTGVSNVPLLLSYSVNEGNSWTGLTTVATENSGNFLAVWFPPASGIYLLNAQWAGNSTLSGANTTINFAVLPYQQQNVFSISSNSTISAYTFNSTSDELSFTVSGPSGTTGYVDLDIPKSLITDVSSLKIRLDGAQMAYSSSSQGDFWKISFAYHHSTHQVIVNLGTASSTPFIQSKLGELLLAGTIVIAITIALVFVLSRRRVRQLALK
jgi:hypothetical protein